MPSQELQGILCFPKALIEPPPKTKFPNWKVQALLMWMDFIFTPIWMLGVSFFIYDISMRFKGGPAKKIG